ncbi:MAG: hypothetical protein LUI39_10740 [Lachnospiraceae bacterium]|nr:hypothetical protein [Lachnospiraceae bacterium]
MRDLLVLRSLVTEHLEKQKLFDVYQGSAGRNLSFGYIHSAHDEDNIKQIYGEVCGVRL